MENKKRDDTATIVADIYGVTASYVRLVVNGKRKNGVILESYNTLREQKQAIVNDLKQNQES
jgi:flavorubredoxin